MNHTPTDYQQAIYDFVTNGHGDAAVNAVAGSGKTTTIVEAAKRVHSDSIGFFAFNKSIVEELQSRLPSSVTVKTINGLGHGALIKHLGKVRLDANKYREIVFNLLKSERFDKDQFSEVQSAVVKLVGFAQSSLSDASDDSLAEIADNQGVNVVIKGVSEGLIYKLVRETLTIGESDARRGVVSFDDQIWLPVKWGIRPVQFDFIFVDEAQDLSPAKLELILSARALGGRIVFVGDPRQAIYGFAGADSQSFQNIVERTQATVLPLSVTWRVPTSAVALAKQIVPAIEAAPTAIEGTVRTIKDTEIQAHLKSGDLVLSRTTAPLIRLAISLIRQRIPARVKGRDIAKGLLAVAKSALGKKYAWSEFHAALDDYFEAESNKLATRKYSEAQVQALEDKIEGLRAAYEGFNSPSFEDFSREVEGLFSDGTAVIELSTVHRAKGLEAQNVFIIEPEKLPLTWKGQRDWQYVQEENLRYVAITRVQNTLTFVETSKKEGA